MEFKLKDLVNNIYSGGTPNTREESYWNGSIKWLSSGETKKSFIYDTERTITESGVKYSSTRLAKKGSIVIASAGQGFTRGQTSLVMEDMYINQSLICVECNLKKINNYYLYYKLKNKYNYLRAISDSNSIRGSLTTLMIRELKIDIPDLKKQEKIGKILFEIDRKIETNGHINDNLLELIKILYIEKIKNNNKDIFEDKTLDEFCNIFTGKKNANASEENGKYKFFTCAPEPLNINTYIYDGPAVIVAGNGAYTGRTNFYNGKFDLYQRTYGITTNNDYIYLFYAMIYADLQNDIMGGTHGSAIPYIVMNDIAKFKVKYNKEIFDELSEKIKSLLLKIKCNELENETLTDLRDTLLPKLMNGEIDLDKIEI